MHPCQMMLVLLCQVARRCAHAHHLSLTQWLACVRVQGIQMQPDTVTQFQDDIYAGRWDEALTLLPQLTFDAGVALQASPATAWSPFLSMEGMRFLQLFLWCPHAPVPVPLCVMPCSGGLTFQGLQACCCHGSQDSTLQVGCSMTMLGACRRRAS